MSRRTEYDTVTDDPSTQNWDNMVENMKPFEGDIVHHKNALELAKESQSSLDTSIDISNRTRSSTHTRTRTRSSVLNAHGPCGSTPLVAACMGGNADLVGELLVLGADPTLSGTVQIERTFKEDYRQQRYLLKFQITPLRAAARFGHGDIVRKLLKSLEPTLVDVYVNQVDSHSNETLLYTACIKGNADVVAALMETDVLDTNLVTRREKSTFTDTHALVPLVAACAARSSETVKILLSAGKTDVNVVLESIFHNCVDDSPTATTPLMMLCNQRLSRKWTSFTTAGEVQLRLQRQAKKAEIATMLLGAGADMTATSKFQMEYYNWPGAEGGWPALHHACAWYNISVAEVLIAHGADANGYSVSGITPLIVLLTNGMEDEESWRTNDTRHNDSINTIKMLLKNGADPHLVGSELSTGNAIKPLHAALQWPEAALLLLNHEPTTALYDVNETCRQVMELNSPSRCINFGDSPLNGFPLIHFIGMNMESYMWTAAYKRSYGHNATQEIDVKRRIAFSDYNHSDNLELLVKLLSYEGSTGRLDTRSASNQRNADGETVLHLVCKHFGTGMRKYDNYNPYLPVLMAAYLNIGINAFDSKQLTALHHIVCADEYYSDQLTFSSAALLLAFGADTNIPSGTTGKTAFEMVAQEAAAPIQIESNETVQNLPAIKLHQFFAATSGWSPLAIGAGCRLHREIVKAVERGTMNLDDFELYELQDALAKARTASADLDWPDAPDICNATVRLMDSAVKSWRRGWIPAGHFLFHSGVQTAVHTIILVQYRLQSKLDDVNKAEDTATAAAAAAAAKAMLLPTLPTEVWHYIMSFFARYDWEAPPLDTGWILGLMKANKML